MIKRANRENGRVRERTPMPHGAAPEGGWPQTTTGSYDRMVRFEGKSLAYFIVFEETKLGWPHLHVLCRTEWLDTDWLSVQMAELIGSPVVKVRRVDDASKIAGYVAKYVGKSAHAFEGCKRWWMTPSYRVLERDERPIVFDAPGNWERIDLSLDEWINEQRTSGMWAWKYSDRRAFALRPG